MMLRKVLGIAVILVTSVTSASAWATDTWVPGPPPDTLYWDYSAGWTKVLVSTGRDATLDTTQSDGGVRTGIIDYDPIEIWDSGHANPLYELDIGPIETAESFPDVYYTTSPTFGIGDMLYTAFPVVASRLDDGPGLSVTAGTLYDQYNETTHPVLGSVVIGESYVQFDCHLDCEIDTQRTYFGQPYIVTLSGSYHYYDHIEVRRDYFVINE